MSVAILSRNAIASLGQILVSSLLMLVLFRVLVASVGAEGVGIWSLVLACGAISRLAELGFTDGVIRFVADAIGRGDRKRAASDVCLGAVAVAVLLGVGIAVVFLVFDFAIALTGAAPETRAAARGLLPIAMASLWVSGIAGVLLSGIDGCQRMDLRSLIVSAGTALNVGAAVALVGPFGLKGVAWAHLGQSLFVLLAAAFALSRMLPLHQVSVRGWTWPQVCAFLGYGVNVQIAALAMLLFDPTTKVLLGRFGGLGEVGYYEMANGFVARGRTLIGAAFRAMMPAVAAGGEGKDTGATPLYLRAQALLAFLLPSVFALIAAAIPAVSALFLRQQDAQFCLMAWLLCAGWAVNTLAVPAFFHNMGSGRLQWNTIGQVVMGLLNAALASAFGRLFGWYGVVAGSVLALAIGSGVIVVAFHREHGIALAELIPGGSRLLLLVSLIAAVGLALATSTMMPPSSGLAVALLPAAAMALVLAPFVLTHPMLRTLKGLVARGVRRS